MPVKKKKFIDKKNALTFHLVHRSQKDPLQASEDASKHVLLPTEKKNTDDIKEEQRKYGVYFDDDYDYMQHLKDAEEVCEMVSEERVKILADQDPVHPKVNLPSTVFASNVETEIGLLNKAAPISGPKVDWDPDIVAALDEDFDHENPENTLEDDFILKANAPAGTKESSDGVEFEDEEDDEYSDVASDEADISDDDEFNEDFYGREHMFMDEETKSRFTSYSMSSSVIKRNDGLTLLDDRFEKFYEQFDDSEIGALDHEDIDGNLTEKSEVLNTILEEFEKQQKVTKLKDMVDEKESKDCEVESEEDENLVHLVIEQPKEKWDCESILSTYSNLYNQPRLIEEPTTQKQINLTSKIGIPKDVLEEPKCSRRQMEKQLHAELKADRACTFRPKDETTDEKKARKQAIKEERKGRREEKKQNKEAFTKEKLRQNKEMLNLKNNLQGVKIV